MCIRDRLKSFKQDKIYNTALDSGLDQDEAKELAEQEIEIEQVLQLGFKRIKDQYKEQVIINNTPKAIVEPIKEEPLPSELLETVKPNNVVKLPEPEKRDIHLFAKNAPALKVKDPNRKEDKEAV